jgi:hypothetical protein
MISSKMNEKHFYKNTIMILLTFIDNEFSSKKSFKKLSEINIHIGILNSCPFQHLTTFQHYVKKCNLR